MIDGAQDKKKYRKAVWFWGSLAVILLAVILHAGRLWLMTRQWLEIYSIGHTLTAEQRHEWGIPSFARSMQLSHEVATQSEKLDLKDFDFFTVDEELDELNTDYRICISVANWLQTSPDDREKVLQHLAGTKLIHYEKSFYENFVRQSLEWQPGELTQPISLHKRVLGVDNAIEVSNYVHQFCKLAYTLAHKAMLEGDHESALAIMCGIPLVAWQFESENSVWESMIRLSADSIRQMAARGVLEIVDGLEMQPDRIIKHALRLQLLASQTRSLHEVLDQEHKNLMLILSNWQTEYPCLLTKSLNSPGSRRYIDELHREKLRIIALPFSETASAAQEFSRRLKEQDNFSNFYLHLLKNFAYPDAVFIRGYYLYEHPPFELAALIEESYLAEMYLSMAVTALYVRAWQLEHGSLPESHAQVEAWSGHKLPDNPITGQAFVCTASATTISTFDSDGKLVDCFLSRQITHRLALHSTGLRRGPARQG